MNYAEVLKSLIFVFWLAASIGWACWLGFKFKASLPALRAKAQAPSSESVKAYALQSAPKP